MRTLRGRVSRRRSCPRGLPTVLAVPVLGAALLLPGSTCAGAVPAATAPARTGVVGAPSANAAWQAVWRDDFTGRAGAPPAAANWLIDRGHAYPGGPQQWGTGEIEEYTADPVNLGQDGRGNLRITATRGAGSTWRSARIETVRGDFQPAPGGRLRIEARIQLPGGGQGYWPAFWALGSPYRVDSSQWPAAGEVDVMENINNASAVHGTVHCGRVEVGGPCREDTGLTGAYRLGAPAGTAGFHVYTVVWSTAPARLDWYVDDRPFWSVTAATMGTATWRSTFGHGFFLLLDLAIGGGWPGAPAAGTRCGQAMLVDYVAVYRGGAAAALLVPTAPRQPRPDRPASRRPAPGQRGSGSA